MKGVILEKAFANRSEFDAAVKGVEKALGKNVVRVRYALDYDSTGDPGVFFKIVLPDASVTKDNLWNTTQKVAFLIEQKLDPVGLWGVYPYYRFRSQSEQEAMQEASWA